MRISQDSFEHTSRISNRLLFQLTQRFIDRLASGSIFDSLQALTSVAPAALDLAPHLIAFGHQSRGRQGVDAGARFPGGARERPPHIACLLDATVQTDTGAFLRDVDHLGAIAGAGRTILAFGADARSMSGRVEHFLPVDYLTLPDGDGITLAFPPLLDLVDFLDSEQFTAVVIGAPGLAGLAMLAAAKLTRVRTIGLFQTDVFGIIRSDTDDPSIEFATSPYVRWFYEQMDEVYMPGESVARSPRGLSAA